MSDDDIESEQDDESSDDDFLALDMSSAQSNDADILDGSESSWSRQITSDSESRYANFGLEHSSQQDKGGSVNSCYEPSQGSPMMQIKTLEQAMGRVMLKNMQVDPLAGLKFLTPQLEAKANKPTQQMKIPGTMDTHSNHMLAGH